MGSFFALFGCFPVFIENSIVFKINEGFSGISPLLADQAAFRGDRPAQKIAEAGLDSVQEKEKRVEKPIPKAFRIGPAEEARGHR